MGYGKENYFGTGVDDVALGAASETEAVVIGGGEGLEVMIDRVVDRRAPPTVAQVDRGTNAARRRSIRMRLTCSERETAR